MILMKKILRTIITLKLAYILNIKRRNKRQGIFILVYHELLFFSKYLVFSKVSKGKPKCIYLYSLRFPSSLSLYLP